METKTKVMLSIIIILAITCIAQHCSGRKTKEKLVNSINCIQKCQDMAK